MVDADRITLLEAQVEALEEALENRSKELRTIQRHLCAPDLRIVCRVVAGLEPVPVPGSGDEDEGEGERSALDEWEETTALVEMEVEPVLERLWAQAERERDRDGSARKGWA